MFLGASKTKPRSRHSTTDHLVRFETSYRETYIHNQHLVSVFFNLEKAYHSTWKYGILKYFYGTNTHTNIYI